MSNSLKNKHYNRLLFLYSVVVRYLAMGMYDSVMVKCPKCVKEHEFQTKSGECFLDVYTLDNCPDDVMVDVNRHSPYNCDCGEVFQVDIPTRKAVSV